MDVELVVSELVTNALLHDSLGAGDAVKLAIGHDDGYLRVAVEDRGDFTKRFGASYVPGGAGLGLRIVDELCDRWEAAPGALLPGIGSSLAAPRCCVGRGVVPAPGIRDHVAAQAA